jgi:hypothetical protein
MRAATTVEPGSHWAGVVAQTTLERAEGALQAHDAKAEQAARFRELVRAAGGSFFEDVAVALQDAARAFNVHVGVDAVVFRASADGQLSVRATRDGAYVLIAPDLGTRFSNQPGAMVTVRHYRRGGARPYDLVMEGTTLRMWVDGQALSAEAFARHALEPWLRDVQPASTGA